MNPYLPIFVHQQRAESESAQPSTTRTPRSSSVCIVFLIMSFYLSVLYEFGKFSVKAARRQCRRAAVDKSVTFS